MSEPANIAVVTGGAAGIGAEICRQMLEAGYEVVVLDRQKPKQSHAKLHAIDGRSVRTGGGQAGGRRDCRHASR